jgi:hypothetical protein
MEKYLMSYEEYNHLINTDATDTICYEFEFLSRSQSGLPVNILLDEELYYKNWGNGRQKFIMIQNNYKYKTHYKDNLLMTISDDPQMYLSYSTIKIKESDIEKVRQFVIKYKKQLEKLANMKIDHCDFLEILDEEFGRKWCEGFGFKVGDIFEDSNGENQIAIEVSENNELIVAKNLNTGIIDKFWHKNINKSKYDPRLNENETNLIV